MYRLDRYRFVLSSIEITLLLEEGACRYAGGLFVYPCTVALRLGAKVGLRSLIMFYPEHSLFCLLSLGRFLTA